MGTGKTEFSDVQGTIERIVKQQLAPARILFVRVEEDDDTYGEPVLHVSAIYDKDVGRPEASKLLGLVRHLRPKLAEHEEERFPLMSVVASDEMSDSAGAS